MAYFAKLDENNIVLEVVSVDNKELLNPDGIEEESLGIAFLTNLFNYPNWLQTSYNGRIRKNYAGEGFSYDSVRNAFIPTKPYSSWLLDEETCRWVAPVPLPNDGKVYVWDESIVNWMAIRND